ncbi:hypothetical protein BDV12DRAFT_202327 [Aspergillus spectabilis]
MPTPTCTIIENMCEPCRSHFQEARKSKEYQLSTLLYTPGIYPVLYYHETTTPGNPKRAAKIAQHMEVFLADLYGKAVKVYSEMINFRLSDQDPSDAQPGSSFLYLVEFPQEVDESLIAEYGLLAGVDISQGDWQIASPQCLGCPNLVRLLFFEASTLKEVQQVKRRHRFAKVVKQKLRQADKSKCCVM